jgi:hypothetical protein
MLTLLKQIILYIIVVACGIFVGYLLFNKYNIVYHGKNSEDIKNKIIRSGDKCYMFKPVVCMCPFL